MDFYFNCKILKALDTLVVCLGYVCNKNELQVEPEWVEKDEKKKLIKKADDNFH